MDNPPIPRLWLLAIARGNAPKAYGEPPQRERVSKEKAKLQLKHKQKESK